MSVLQKSGLQISPRCLINFDTLEQSLEVSRSEALVITSLDDFNEDSWTILNRLGEYLEQVAVIVVVNQNQITDVKRLYARSEKYSPNIQAESNLNTAFL